MMTPKRLRQIAQILRELETRHARAIAAELEEHATEVEALQAEKLKLREPGR